MFLNQTSGIFFNERSGVAAMIVRFACPGYAVGRTLVRSVILFGMSKYRHFASHDIFHLCNNDEEKKNLRKTGTVCGSPPLV